MILTDISTYDSNKHTAYPTLEYILEETGEDLAQGTDTTEQAERRVRYLTDRAKAIFNSTKMLKTALDFEYLIATREDYRRAWLSYVITCISTVVFSGNLDMMTPTRETDLSKILSGVAQAELKSGLLSADQFTFINYELHVGY